jgi:hypothetical protein
MYISHVRMQRVGAGERLGRPPCMTARDTYGLAGHIVKKHPRCTYFEEVLKNRLMMAAGESSSRTRTMSSTRIPCTPQPCRMCSRRMCSRPAARLEYMTVRSAWRTCMHIDIRSPSGSFITYRRRSKRANDYVEKKKSRYLPVCM